MEKLGHRILIGLSIALTILGVTAAVTMYRLKQEVARLEGERAAASERERVMDQQLARERVERLEAGAALRRERTRRPAHAGTDIVTLRPGPPAPHARSAEIVIGPDQEVVALELTLPELAASTFRAGLRSAPGDEFWMQSRLKPQAERRVIAVEIPASALPPADYELALEGLDGRGKSTKPIYYYFAVTRD